MVDYKANPVSKVSCMNCGAVIMDFCIKPDGGREPDIKSFRKQIKANQSKTIDVDELGLEDGQEFTIVVAICGHNKLVTTRQKLVYKCGCDETAYFRLTGTLCTAKIELVQLGTPRVS